jgi:hypothetical protein
MESIGTENGGITSWSQLNLNEVVTERAAGEAQERTELPAGNYTFKFVGAKQNPYEPLTTDLDFVVTQGPHSKRHLFARLPGPNVTKYAPQWAAILVKRLGGSQLPGEDLITLLNRIAPTANAITADVTDDTYFSTSKGINVTKPKLMFFSINAA